MNALSEYSYIWGTNKDKYVLLNDEFGDSILFINGNEVLFFLVEDDTLADSIIAKMIENGNKVYTSIAELQKAINVK